MSWFRVEVIGNIMLLQICYKYNVKTSTLFVISLKIGDGIPLITKKNTTKIMLQW